MSRHSTKFIVDWTFYTKKIKKKKNRERDLVTQTTQAARTCLNFSEARVGGNSDGITIFL